MSLKNAFETITRKTAEVGRQKAEIIRKLEENKNEKSKYEAAKAASLEAKDEKAYKEACRAIADADAGIEFNSICLNEFLKKKHATEADDNQIKRGLRQGLNEIYVDAVLQIEELAIEMQNVSESAIEKMKKIDAMAELWDKNIMNQTSTTTLCSNKSITLFGFYNGAKARITQLEMLKKDDPFFKKGEK